MFIERRELDKNNNGHVKQPFNNETTVPVVTGVFK